MLNYDALKQFRLLFNIEIIKIIDHKLNFHSPNYLKENEIPKLINTKNNKKNIIIIDATSFIYQYNDNIKTIRNLFFPILKKVQIYCSQNNVKGIIFLMDQRLMKVKHFDDYEFVRGVLKTPNIKNFEYNNKLTEEENNLNRFNFCNSEFLKFLGKEDMSEYVIETLKKQNNNYNEKLQIKTPENYIKQLYNKDFKFFIIDIIIELLKDMINLPELTSIDEDKFLILSSYNKYYFIDSFSYGLKKRSDDNIKFEKILNIQYCESDQIIPYLCEIIKNNFNIYVCGSDGDLLIGLLNNTNKRIINYYNDNPNVNDFIFENEIIVLKNFWRSNPIKNLEYYNINNTYKDILTSLISILKKKYIIKYNSIDIIFYFTTIISLCKNDYIDNKKIPSLGAATLIKNFFNINSFNYFYGDFIGINKTKNIISLNYIKFIKFIKLCYLNTSYSNNMENIKSIGYEYFFKNLNEKHQTKLLNQNETKLKDGKIEIQKFNEICKKIKNTNYISLNGMNNLYSTLIFSINYFSTFYPSIENINYGYGYNKKTKEYLFGFNLKKNEKNEFGLYPVTLKNKIMIKELIF